MRTARIIAGMLCVFASTLSPISSSGLVSVLNATETEEISESQIWSGEKNREKSVVVSPGATLVIEKGTQVRFTQPGLVIEVHGSLLIEGTLNDPVSLGSDIPTGGRFSIQSFPGSQVMIRSAEISNGGSIAYLSQGIMKTAFAASYQGALHISGGRVDIQNVTFRQNRQAVFVSERAAEVRVNRSRFLENDMDVFAPSGDDFRYNWWGSPEGPRQTCEEYDGTPSCYYETIDGDFDRSNPLQQETFRDPVVVIPGMLGSYPVLYGQSTDPIWALDPLFQRYRDLVASLKKNGLDGDVYEFPYDWRESNELSAKLLEQKIQQIKEERHWPQVDIVAHSMGGLVARQYIESDQYAHDIDQLITLGTPQLGAPEAFVRWDGATILGPGSLLYRFVFKQWAKHEGFADVYDYLHEKPLLSVQELLPVYPYLARLKEGEYTMTPYGEGYPKNTFLERLNDAERVQRLALVEFTKIVGKLADDEGTIGGFRVIDKDTGKYWQHGYPDNIESLDPSNEARGIIGSDGDGTVPLVSAIASDIASDSTVFLQGVSHNDLPTEGQAIVLETLGMPKPYVEVRMSKIEKMLAFFLFSPIDIQVISPSGKRVGKNFIDGTLYAEIPGAFYTGYQTKNEFITIPNPEEGEYRVLTQGTESGGSYRVEISRIEESQAVHEPAMESMVTLAGTATPEEVTEASIVVTPEAVTMPEPQTPKDTTSPITTLSLSGTEGQNHWYTGPVTVTLTAQDDTGGSGLKDIQYSLDAGQTWVTYTQPVLITQEGITKFAYHSTDQADNQENTRSQAISLDQTPPEVKIAFHPQTQKLDITGTDALDEHLSPAVLATTTVPLRIEGWQKLLTRFLGIKWPTTRSVTTAALADAAGHTTVLTFEQPIVTKSSLDTRLTSLAYDGQATALSARLQYQWRLDEDAKQRFTRLATFIRTPQALLETHYFPNKNLTHLMKFSKELPENESESNLDRRPIREKLPGLVIPGLLSEKGKVAVVY